MKIHMSNIKAINVRFYTLTATPLVAIFKQSQVTEVFHIL